jgi:hypothetical protein
MDKMLYLIVRIPGNQLYMSLKNCLLLLVFTGMYFSVAAQRRVTVDANTRLNSLYFTANYLSVIGNKFFWTAGIEGGSYGIADLYSKTAGGLTAPYSYANEILVRDGAEYLLKGYISKTSGIGIAGGIGRFFNFTKVHGLRLETTLRWIYFEDRFTGGYVNNTGSYPTYKRTLHHESAFALTLNIYHTIAVGENSTFYYGCKTPYFIPITHAGYKPVNAGDMMKAGREMQLTLGISFMLPKKQEKTQEAN